MRLFNSAETNFNTLGICSLNQCLSCTVTEELNGSYELTMTYHMDSKGFNELKHRRIIYAKPNPYSLEQPFRIYSISTPINRVVTVNAAHISYDLSGYVVDPFSASDAKTAINSLTSNALIKPPFIFHISGDLEDGEIDVKNPQSIKKVMGEHIIPTYKLEMEYDHNEVYFKQRRGFNNGVTIKYGKNLLDINHEEDSVNVYTDVYPFWHGQKRDNESGESEEIFVTLTNKLIKVNADFNFTNILLLDLSSNFQEEPTEEELIKDTEKYIKDHKIGEPTVSMTVDFMQLTSSEEYHKYRLLDKVMLGDYVTIEFNEANIYGIARCIKTTYSPILNKYTEIELGEATSRLTDRISNDIQKTQERNDQALEQHRTYFNKALVDLTNSITGNSGGYVLLNPPSQPQELLVMDAPKKEDAVIVWRWNKEGLGVSTTGYNGPFQGIGVNGKLVINEATAYKMTAFMLEGGILSSIDGSLQMSLEDEYFELAHPDANTRTRLDENGFYILDQNGETIASLASKDSWSSLVADTVFARNIENVYIGDANLYVNHSKSGAGSGTIDDPFTDFQQLKDFLEYMPIINKDLTINVLSTGEVSDNLDLRGLSGRGIITIFLDKNLTLVGNGSSLYGLYFYKCDNKITVEGGRSSYSSTDGALINKFGIGVGFNQCKYGEVKYMAIDTYGGGSEQWGVLFRNTNGAVRTVDFVNSYNAIFADKGSNVYDYDSCGNSTNCYYVMSAATVMYGETDSNTYRPMGDIRKISGNILSIGFGAGVQASYRDAPDMPSKAVYTQSFGATSFGTYQYAWSNWASDEWGNRAIQGVWESYGNKAGHIFFDMNSIRSFIGNGTVKSATITLTRRNAGGYSSATNIYLNGSSVSSAAGTPSYSNHTHIGSLSWGEKKTFTVPNSILLSIKNGTANSLACYSNSYSSSYAEIVAATLTIKVEKPVLIIS